MLFGSYRRSDAADPDTYVAAVAAVLALYSTDLIREVTDPRTGIQTSEKFMAFMPNAGELKHYCEGIAARNERLKRLGERRAPDPQQARLAAPEGAPGSFAHVFVPPGHQRYAGLVEWARTANPKFFRYGKSSDGVDGIWVAYNVWDDGARGRSARTLGGSSFWADAEWLQCADGKARRAKPGIRLLVDGMAGRTDLWRLAGNSIVPQIAAEVLKALLETL